MHYLKLLLEPVALIAFGWAWVTFSLWRRRQAPWKLSLVLLLAFWFLASPFGANGMLWLLERPYRHPVICEGALPSDPVVILGGGKVGWEAEPDQVEVLMEASFIRTFAGLRLWRELGGQGPMVVSGGGHGPVKEADLIAHLLRQAGVPAEQLLLERASMSTADNARGVAVLFEQAPRKTIYLVTSAAHMPRASAAFSRAGLEVCPWGVDKRAFRPDLGGMWIPSLRPLEKSSAALHEIKGLIWYRLGGEI